MAPQRSCLLSFLCLLVLQLSLTIRIEDKSRNIQSKSTTTTSTTTKAPASVPVYRVSRPQPKQANKRVPPHLQDVRPGYVDDDAGDVIRIIEPPAHFQQLKRMRQRQPQPNAPLAPQTAVVWEQPRKLSTNRGRPKLPPNGDLLTQETQHSPQIANNLQLPMEILASVRKTERLLQRQRQKVPHVRQRHIQRQTHTLIAQKSLEQQLYQRGQQQRLRAALTQDHKRSKRVKRELENRYDVAQGLKLVAHIGELLQNATRYLPDELAPNELAPKSSPLTSEIRICGNATNCDSRRRRQRLFKLQGSKKTVVRGRNFRHEASNKTTTTAVGTTTKTNVRLTTTTSTTTAATVTANSTTSATPLASRLVNSRKSPNNRNQHRQHLPLPPSSPRSDDTVLYADVMSNIQRNLWQEHDHDLTSAPQFVAPEQVANNTDYRALNVYLRELDEISKRLPTVAPITALNREEFRRATSSPNWYLINNEGKIYETRLDSETKPTAGLFHRFPDTPVSNDSVLTQNLE